MNKSHIISEWIAVPLSIQKCIPQVRETQEAASLVCNEWDRKGEIKKKLERDGSPCWQRRIVISCFGEEFVETES